MLTGKQVYDLFTNSILAFAYATNTTTALPSTTVNVPNAFSLVSSNSSIQFAPDSPKSIPLEGIAKVVASFRKKQEKILGGREVMQQVMDAANLKHLNGADPYSGRYTLHSPNQFT